MRICVISTSVFAVGNNGLAGYGGLEQIAWQTAKGLAAKGHEVALVAPEGSFCPNVSIIPTGPPGQWDEKKSYEKYWQHLLGFECICDHSWSKYAYLLKQEGRLKAPVLGVLHAPVPTMYQSLPAVEKPCFVCISQDQADHFSALFNREARVCRNGIDTEMYKPIGIPRSKRYLFLARFSTIKGPDLAIEACLKSGVGLDLIGDTSITNEPELLAKCKKMADGEQIRLIGPVGRGECVWWFSQAHCLLHPNKLFREPLGLAPIEAQSCGTGVLAWNFGAMRETVNHGETGFLVKSLEEMIELIRADAAGTIDRNLCRKWVESNFTEQMMVNRYAELCREAVETGGW